MKVRNYLAGTMLAFSYDKNGTERPSFGVIRRVHRMVGGWLVVMFDFARGAERSFWEHRMSQIRVTRFAGTNLSGASAEGMADGMTGEGVGAVSVRMGLSRDTHGLHQSHAVLCVREYRKTA